MYKSFDLHFLKIMDSSSDPKLCLSLEDTRDRQKAVGLCVMPTSLKRNQSISDAKSEWVYDIEFFRDKCQEKTKFVTEEEDNSKRLMLELEAKEDHYERIREKEEEEKQKEVQGKIDSTAHVAMEVRI